MSWFKRRREPVVQPPQSPVKYPNGVCVRTETGEYYLHGGKKYKIKSANVFKSWNFPTVLDSTDAAISAYPNSLRRLGFRDGTLVRDIYDTSLYIISEGKRIPVKTVELYDLLNVDNAKIPYVSHEDVIFHEEGGL